MNVNLRYIKQKYSKENIKRLWDSFSLKTRERIKSGLDENNINVNKLFDEQSIDGENEIITKFKHAGINLYIGLDKNF